VAALGMQIQRLTLPTDMRRCLKSEDYSLHSAEFAKIGAAVGTAPLND
jgi:hypothetical protein